MWRTREEVNALASKFLTGRVTPKTPLKWKSWGPGLELLSTTAANDKLWIDSSKVACAQLKSEIGGGADSFMGNQGSQACHDSGLVSLVLASLEKDMSVFVVEAHNIHRGSQDLLGGLCWVKSLIWSAAAEAS